MKQNKELRRGEELEPGVSWFRLTLSLTERGKVLNEQTLFAIYHPGVSCNPPGRVGFGIGRTYELLTLFWTGSGRTLYWTGGKKASPG